MTYTTLDYSGASIGSQYGKETTAGTTTAANRKFPIGGITMNPAGTIQELRQPGSLVPTGTVLMEESSDGTIAGSFAVDELWYIFCNLLQTVTPSAVPAQTGAYLSDFLPPYNAFAATDSWTVEVGDPNLAMMSGADNWRYTGVKVTDLTITVSHKTLSYSGKLFGRQVIDQIAMTSSPTTFVDQVLTPNMFDIGVFSAWPTGTDMTGGTALGSAFEWKLNITGRHLPVWKLKSADASMDGSVLGALKVTTDLTIGADYQSHQFIASMRNGARNYFRLLGVGPNIPTTTQPFKALFDWCAMVGKPFTASDQSGVYAHMWSMTPVPDQGATGKWLEAQLWNNISGF